MITQLYGIKNCDAVKKTRKWLEQQGLEYHFHDFREDGLEPVLLRHWFNEVGADVLVNRRSTTWKHLTEADREKALSADGVDVLLQHPTLIKRPVICLGDKVHVGFREALFQQLPDQ
jgi:arsenate reductase